jgi:hypothetical protein
MRKRFFAARYIRIPALILALATFCGAAHAASAQGTYTGIYTGDDFGTVTIVIDSQGKVTCDFLSTPKHIHYQASGALNTTSASFQLNCNSADSASYYWTLASDPTSVAGSAINGLWGGNTGAGQISGSVTAYYSSASTDPAGSLTTGSFAGLWYDSTFTRTGFNILPSSAGLIVTYYGVSASGKPLWLISTDLSPKLITLNTPITLNMSYSSSGTFQAPVSSPVTWGQLNLTFTSCTKATATLSGTDGTISENLTMLVGGMGMPGCQ